MSADELYQYICMYVVDDVFTFEERRSMGLESFHQYVKEHFVPIPKSELVVGQEYNGHCRNASRATWNGKVFQYMRKKFGGEFLEEINHYEDDYDPGIDVFVPVKEI